MREQMEESWAASVGNTVVAGIGHGLLWCVKLIAKYPMNSVGLAVLGLGFALGGANALWMQPGKHPSPLFMETVAVADTPDTVLEKKLPVTPLKITAPNVTTPNDETSGVVSTLPAPVASRKTSSEAKTTVIGNKDVAAMQNKLAALGLFTGKVDGYYGPATANAIRAFEQENGLSPKGALTPEILKAISGKQVTVQIQPKVTSRAVFPAPAPKRTVSNSAKKLVVAAAPVKTPLVVAPVQRAKPKKLDPIEKIALTATPSAPKTTTPKRSNDAVMDKDLINTVQTGLVRLGFLTEITGKFDASTARAIREFENYNNYTRTGELSPELIDMLGAANAFN